MGTFSSLLKTRKPSADAGTPNDWSKYLHDNKNFRELEPFLLSNQQPYKNKKGVILKILNSLGKDDLLWFESMLNSLGYDSLTQTIRWKFSRTMVSGSDRLLHMEWAQKVVEADIKTRWIAQRQEYVKEEVLALRKALGLCKDDEKEVQLEAYKVELQRLDNEYWAHSHLTWTLHEGVQSGVLTRSFRQHRSNPRWYLRTWLQEECARRGGCCGRDCECCRKENHRGHCTSSCGCCIRTRGFDGTDGDMNDLIGLPFDLATTNQSQYSERVYLAYIWGLYR